MIQASELRIGNWIGNNLKEFPNNIFQVLEVGETLKLKQGNEIDYYHIDDFQPITLTPEILEKCGFKKLKGGKDIYSIVLNGTEISVNPKLQFVYIETDFGHARINSLPYPQLHQLQNLIFALTGEELTIPLT